MTDPAPDPYDRLEPLLQRVEEALHDVRAEVSRLQEEHRDRT